MHLLTPLDRTPLSEEGRYYCRPSFIFVDTKRNSAGDSVEVSAKVSLSTDLLVDPSRADIAWTSDKWNMRFPQEFLCQPIAMTTHRMRT